VDNRANIHYDHDFLFQLTCEYGHLIIIKFPMKNGTNVYSRDDYALQMACKYEYSEAAKFLVKKKEPMLILMKPHINIWYIRES